MKRNGVYPNPPSTHEILRIQKALQENGYVLTSDVALGMPPDLHQHIDAKFFTDQTLGPEVPGVVPIDRLRACDVVEFKYNDDGLELEEYPIVTIRPILDAKKPREYKRVYTLEDPKFITWMSTFLSMVPPNEQQNHGTLGFHFFRTFRDLVAYKHQDQEQFVCIYVLARETDGAVTSLYPINDPDRKLMEVTLQPGEWLVFRDRDFMHDATPLRPRFEGDQQFRDAIVGFVHYPTTFLNPAEQGI